MKQYKYIMLYCKADGVPSTKYSLECLYQFSWCMVFDTKRSNNFVKQGIKNLGPNVTEKAVSRLAFAQSSINLEQSG